MSQLRLAPRNLFDLFVLSSEIAPDPGFEIENVQNTIRGKVWRSPDTTGQYIAGTRSSAVTLNCLYLFRHHCHGGSLRFRAYAGASQTGSLLVDSGVVPVFTPDATGYDHGYADSGMDSRDPYGTEAPYFFYFGAAAIQSFRIDFSSKSTTYSFDFWEIGRLFGGNYLELEHDPIVGTEYLVMNGDESERTRGGTKRSSVGARWDALRFDLNAIQPIERQAWIDIANRAQTSRDMALSMVPGEGGRLERDLTKNVTFSNVDALGFQAGWSTRRVQLESC